MRWVLGRKSFDGHRGAVLTQLGQCGYAIHEEPGEYQAGGDNTDSDTDLDSDGKRKPENELTRLLQ
jgi:hypothetical protein